MDQPENAIVVGVPGEGSDSALVFAVAEARRSGSPLHLLHVLHLRAGEAYDTLYGEALESAQALTEAAQLRAKDLSDGAVPVTIEVVDRGWVVGDLVERSESARMIVVQHRKLARLHRIVTGSITNGVAARALSPVVAVPEGWQPADGKPAVVTAAVQDPQEAGPILRAAFSEARERKADLVVLHAWWLASGYDTAVVGEDMRTEWEERTRAELEPVLAPLRSRFPMVDVTLEVKHAPPAEAILDAAERSDLVVIGRRHHRLPLFSHLGPVARAVLGHSAAPVLMTPEPEPVPVIVP